MSRSLILLELMLLAFSSLAAQDATLEARLSRTETDTFIAELYAGYEAPAARYEIEIYQLVVETLHPDGKTTPVRVQLFVPRAPAEDIRGSYLFAPGSTGLINPCRVSREHEAGIRWGLYRAHVLSVVGQGFVGILPDYMGYEDWDLIQPYFHAESEARLIVDATVAADAVLAEIVPGGLRALTRVAAGYSQGGHAVFAAADRSDWFPEGLELDGIIGYGPTTSVDALFVEYSSVAPMVVQVYRSIYGDDRFDPFAVLAAEWAGTLAYDTTRQCVGGIQSYYPGDPTLLFETSFLKSLRAGTLARTHPSIDAIMEENRTGLSGHGLPILILQGTEDIVVDRATQDQFVQALRARDSDVRYLVYENARHDTRQIGFPAVLEWIDALSKPDEQEE